MIAALPLYCFMTVATRREVRYRYRLKGDQFEDCWKATFCICCSLVQQEKEILKRKERLGSEGGEGYERRRDRMEYGNAS
jgi:hypothetical protein